MDFEKLDNSNLWDKTYHQLKESIIWRKLKPNEKILIPEVSKMLGVSRTPIRDALNRLEVDGLVVTMSKVGTFVKGIDAETALEITDARLMLEEWSVRRSLEGPEERVLDSADHLDEINRRSFEDLERLPLEEYLKKDYNFAFHLALVMMGGNRTNTDIYRNLMNYRHILYHTNIVSAEMVASANREHEEIVAALRDRDEREILRRITHHLQASKGALIAKIQDNGDMI